MLALPRFARAQQPGRSYRLCWLSSVAPRTESYNVALVERLRELGFVEGRNLTIEFRSAEGRIERLPALGADLARQNCDALFAPGTEANLVALKQASRELMLAQSSDWTFIMSTGTTVPYATRRFNEHIIRFSRLYDELKKGQVDEKYLASVEAQDNIFPDVDYRIYAT